MTRQLVHDAPSTRAAQLPPSPVLTASNPTASEESNRGSPGIAQLAAELHDHFAQSLWCLDLELVDLERLLQRDPASAREHLQVARRRLDDAYRDVRLLIGALRGTTTLDTSFHAAIRLRLQQFGEQTGIACHYDAAEDTTELGKLPEVELLAILEQALQNVRQHARARSVVVVFTAIRSEWVLEIRDDGRGVSSEALQRSAGEGHYGVTIMRERARFLGGSFDLVSAEGAGTTVRARIPRTSAARRRRRTRAPGTTGGERARKATSRR